ncbi:MAG: NAD(P)H-binding protein [Pseudonocardia sp.]|nr:NAD(P)H-binding protein [Pseudonocardia sp.]
MITVLGATGNTGGRVTTLLREAGEPVRAVGRSAARLAEAGARGAEPWVGDITDTAFLTRAFDGVDGAYVLMPLDLAGGGYAGQQERVGTSITAALGAAGVPYVVALSSLGAELPSGTGFLSSLYDQEQRLGALDADVLFLRPGLFFESFLPSLDAMREHGAHADSIEPDVALPMIATRDVAAAAAEALLARDRTGVRELLGPRDMTVPEAVAELGPRIGLPGLGYVRMPDEALSDALVGAGLPADLTALHLAMNAAFNRGVIRSHAGRTADTTTPTTVAEFADSLEVRA